MSCRPGSMRRPSPGSLGLGGVRRTDQRGEPTPGPSTRVGSWARATGLWWLALRRTAPTRLRQQQSHYPNGREGGGFHPVGSGRRTSVEFAPVLRPIQSFRCWWPSAIQRQGLTVGGQQGPAGYRVHDRYLAAWFCAGALGGTKEGGRAARGTGLEGKKNIHDQSLNPTGEIAAK